MSRASLVVWLALLPSVAAGEPPAPPAAQAHIDAGVAAFNAKSYDAASAEFEAAYTLAPLPKLLFGWAQARRLGGHCDEAIPLYRRYLATQPTEQQIEAATTAMLLCERGTEPAPSAPPPAPLPPTIVIREERVPWYRDRAGGALSIAGVLAVGTGATFLVLANHSEQAATRAGNRNEFVDDLDQATLRRRIGWAGIGVGSALVLGGVLRYVLHEEHAPVDIATTGNSISFSARF